MGSMEEAIKPYLEPMIFAEVPNSFSQEDGERLAQWTVKTALMCNLSNHNDSPLALIPLTFYEWFRHATISDLSRFAVVHIGRMDESPGRFDLLLSYLNEAGRPGERDHADVVLFVLKLYRVAITLALFPESTEYPIEGLFDLTPELFVKLLPVERGPHSIEWPGSLGAVSMANLENFIRLGR